MATLRTEKILAFLGELGKRYSQPATLTLLGGSALCLLGSERPTLDLDYVGDDLHKNDLQKLLDQVADEMQVEVEAVPIEHFVPVPANAEQRRIHVAQFGLIDVFIVDPYVIALSKVDRGLDTDIEDVLFLIRRNLITFEELDRVVTIALGQWQEFALNPKALRNHLTEIRKKMGIG